VRCQGVMRRLGDPEPEGDGDYYRFSSCRYVSVHCGNVGAGRGSEGHHHDHQGSTSRDTRRLAVYLPWAFKKAWSIAMPLQQQEICHGQSSVVRSP
jgi:hypothetical protein